MASKAAQAGSVTEKDSRISELTTDLQNLNEERLAAQTELQSNEQVLEQSKKEVVALSEQLK